MFYTLQMRIYKLYLLIKLLFLFDLNFASADCNRGDLQITNINPFVVDFTATSSQNINFQVTHPPFTGSVDCEYLGVINYGIASSYPNRVLTESLSGDTISFNTYKNAPASAANIIRDQFDATTTDHYIYFPIFSPSGSSQTNSHTFLAQVGSIPSSISPGIYTEALVLKIVARPTSSPSGSFYDWPVVAETALQFQYSKERILNVAIVNTGASHNSFDQSQLMNFGKLSTGKSLSADITIETNVGYRLFLSSANDGQLIHESSSLSIPYEMTLSGSTINLTGSSSTPVVASSNANPSPPGSYRLPLTITVGTMSGTELGGLYSDIITTTIEAF